MIFMPNGAKLAISSVISAAKIITDITNAVPGEASSALHGFVAGDIVLVESGWEPINERAIRVGAAEAGTFELEKVDTTDPFEFPEGLAAGSTAKKIMTMTAIDQILANSAQGGDQQYWNYSPLDSRRSKQIRTEKSPQSVTFSLGYDEKKPWFPVLDEADRIGDLRVLQVVLPSRRVILYTGTVSFNKIPSLTKSEGMAVSMTFSINSDVTTFDL